MIKTLVRCTSKTNKKSPYFISGQATAKQISTDKNNGSREREFNSQPLSNVQISSSTY